MKRAASVGRNSRSSGGLSSPVKGFVVCIANPGYSASLEPRKLYQHLEPLPNDPKSLIRVVDESGEDYLYPREFFRRLTISWPVRRALARTLSVA